jgi:diguanylate cyclase (GGDEF)-like protein
MEIKGKKILVVEDEEILRELLRDVLEQAGFNVVVSPDGKDGLEKIYSENPDLILLDCQMPKMDGYEVLQNLRKDPIMINKPVIMLTVKSSEADQLKGINLGVDDYVTKPFNQQILIAKIKTILERKELSISTNPLTHLPGNVAIQKEFQNRISKTSNIVFLYLDLSNFKSYNDYYGFQKGDEVIKHLSKILVSSVKLYDETEGFVGHIGGDDFVIITNLESYKQIAQEIIEKFDSTILNFYSEEDRKRGYIITKDRQGNLQKFPFMTVSIACVSLKKRKIDHYGQLGQIAAELKKYAKKFNKSIMVEDRRIDL